MGRFIPRRGTFHPERQFPQEQMSMSTAAYVDGVRDHVKALEVRAVRAGLSASDARRRVADKLGCAPGTVESIVKGRKKHVDGVLKDRAHALLVKEIEKEIKALEHELETLRRVRSEPSHFEVSEVEACLEKARSLLARATSRAA